ncbi:MAG TPA: AI-2E family transporter [Terriglobales bacterium]|nr:AI-2E family transporter [Terriglobales bacterium]
MESSPLISSTTSRNQIKVAGLLLATLVVIYLCYRILLPFFPALTWAIALAVVTRPLHRVLDRRLRNRTLSSFLAVIIITLVLVIPLFVITEQVVSEGIGAVRTVRSPEFQDKMRVVLSENPRLANAVDWVQQRINISGQAQAIAGTAANTAQAALAVSLAGLGQLFIALFTVFFLLRDFEVFDGFVRGLMPLSRKDADDVISRVKLTIDASVRGRIVIAAIQGTLGGLMFWFLGLPAPLLWGSVMAVFALVPMLGAFVVWVPAALFLVITGHMYKAIILAVWGALVIGTADNLLYPMLVGRDIRMHTVMIFFSVLGGVAAFGASGLVVGPVIFAVAGALIEMWSRRSAPAVVEPVSTTSVTS